MRIVSRWHARLWSSLQGGAIGGAVAGVGIGLDYYRQERDLMPSEVAEIVLFAIVVGVVAGPAAQLGIAAFRVLRGISQSAAWFLNDALGAAFGCSAGVMLMGVLGGLLFGSRTRDPLNLGVLAAISLFGMSVAIVLYETGGRLPRVLLHAVLPMVLSGLLVSLVIWFFDVDLRALTPRESLGDGAAIGGVIGFGMGLQIGLGLMLGRDDALRRMNS